MVSALITTVVVIVAVFFVWRVVAARKRDQAVEYVCDVCGESDCDCRRVD